MTNPDDESGGKETRLEREVRKVLRENLPTKREFVISKEAKRLRRKLAVERPELLQEWEAALSEEVIADFLGGYIRTTRVSHQRLIRSRKVEATRQQIEEAVATGSKWSIFNDALCVGVDEHKNFVQKPIGLIVKPDAQYLADNYDGKSRHYSLESLFWSDVATKLKGAKTVSDVMSESEYRRLYREIVGPIKADDESAD